MTTDQLKKNEATLRQTAATPRANSDFTFLKFSTPGLGLFFLKFAGKKCSLVEKEINAESEMLNGTRREQQIEEIGVEKNWIHLKNNCFSAFLSF